MKLESSASCNLQLEAGEFHIQRHIFFFPEILHIELKEIFRGALFLDIMAEFSDFSDST